MKIKDVKVGAVVECISGYDGNPKVKGQRGKLIHVDTERLRRPGVRFDKNIGGHELWGEGKSRCARGHGWYVPIAKLKLITPAKTKKS